VCGVIRKFVVARGEQEAEQCNDGGSTRIAEKALTCLCILLERFPARDESQVSMFFLVMSPNTHTDMGSINIVCERLAASTHGA